MSQSIASAPAFLPHWMQERWALILVALAGAFFLAGWAGERFLGLPASLALACYILAYLAGGYEIATHAIPGLFKGRFDTWEPLRSCWPVSPRPRATEC